MRNITAPRDASQKETFQDQSEAFLQQSARKFTGLIVGFGPNYYAKLEDFRCVQFGLYGIDADGALVGSQRDGSTSEKLYPILVDKGSWDPIFTWPTDEEVAKITLSFNFSTVEKDQYLQMIPSGDITGINLLTVNGLLDVHVSEEVAPSATSVTVKLFTDYGPINNRETVKGLLITDFYASDLLTDSRIWNVTDNAAVTPSSIVETPANSGIYVITYPSQTVGDVLRLYPKKNGYDFTEIHDGDHDLTAIV
jgi:hypothetical protein